MSVKYSNEHEWIRVEGDVGTIGITNYAQEQLGDVVFVEVPAVGRKVAKGESVAVVESVKAASDIYAPVAGEVTEANAALADTPGDVNTEPMGKGWFFKLKLANPGELDVERAFQGFAARNVSPATAPFFIGAGAYRHHVPATVDYMIQRGEFLTSYTPYQPEITQGTLQYLFEFQTQVTMLTGMEVANASMYDGSTGAAEAVLMANRITRRSKALISGGLHPHYRGVIQTTGHWQGFKPVVGTPDIDGKEDLSAQVDKETSCVIVQNPSFFGHLHDFTRLAQACHAAGALLIVVVTEVVSLGLVMPPGEMGADIVVCEGQSIGNGLGFGGPYVGLFATRDKYVRQMPGRLVGETVDADGKRGFVLTLSTRDQHIRSEKATSNTCNNAGP